MTFIFEKGVRLRVCMRVNACVHVSARIIENMLLQIPFKPNTELSIVRVCYSFIIIIFFPATFVVAE